MDLQTIRSAGGQKCIYSGHFVSKTFAKKYETSHNLLHLAKGSGKNCEIREKKIGNNYANNCNISCKFLDFFSANFCNANNCAGNPICGCEVKLKWVSFLPFIKHHQEGSPRYHQRTWTIFTYRQQAHLSVQKRKSVSALVQRIQFLLSWNNVFRTHLWKTKSGIQDQAANLSFEKTNFDYQFNHFSWGTTSFNWRTTNFSWWTSNFNWRTTNFSWWTSNFSWWTSNFSWRTTNFGLWTFNLSWRTTHFSYGPPILLDTPQISFDGPPILVDGLLILVDGPPIVVDEPPILVYGSPILIDGTLIIINGPPISVQVPPI